MTTELRCWLVSDETCQMFVSASTRGKALLEFVGRYSDCDPDEVFQKGSHFHAWRVPELDGVVEPDVGYEALFVAYGGIEECRHCRAEIAAEPDGDMWTAYVDNDRIVCVICAGPDAQPIRRKRRRAVTT